MLQTVPSWAKKRISNTENLFEMKRLLRDSSVRTVCETSLCPNLTECFSRRYATFLILGDLCTRACGFCSASKGKPLAVDCSEPERIANLVKSLGLKYVVVTSVTRDDLADGGTGQFVEVIDAIRRLCEGVKIEVLVPDFGEDSHALEAVVNARPQVFGHNIETVKRLYPVARRGFDYNRSLTLLKEAKRISPGLATKSGLMAGLGETENELIGTMADLRDHDCDMLTVGQYLRPGKDNLPVQRFVNPEDFERYETIGRDLGFKAVSAGTFVRSSYLAERLYKMAEGDMHDRR